MIVKVALALMVLFGLWGAGRLSFDQYMSGDACPILGDAVPACYIAFAGYILIAAGVALALRGVGRMGSYLFWDGTAVAGGLAALATVLELINGDICPVAFGAVPMCYISLAFSVVIAMLFFYVSRKPGETPIPS